METTKVIKCPYCGISNKYNAVKCSCGFYFEKSKYNEKMESNAELNRKPNIQHDYPFLSLLLIVLYVAGVIIILIGIILLISSFFELYDESMSEIMIFFSRISGTACILGGLFFIAFAKSVKVILKIEANTRKT